MTELEKLLCTDSKVESLKKINAIADAIGASGGLVENQTPYDCINEMSPRNAKLMEASLYSEAEYTSSSTYTMLLTEGDYQIEMYGAGGNTYGTWTYEKAQGWQGGGSGAGFKGVVHLPAGNYQIYVGAVTGGAGQSTTFKNMDNNITYITAGGGGYNGNGFTWDYSTNWRAPGGTLTIHADTEVISSEIARNGEPGNQWGNQFWINTTITDGGKSVANGGDGWGCGQNGGWGTSYGRRGGYFKLSKLGTEFSNLKINDFKATDINGESFEIQGLPTVNLADYEVGTYNIYVNKDRTVTVVQNTNYVQDNEPETPVDGDVWNDVSGYPIKKYKYTVTEEGTTKTEFTDIYLGSVTLGLTEDSSKAISDIKPIMINKGAFASVISGYSMPSGKLVDLTLGASGTTYTAPANGWFYIGKGISANQYFIFDNMTSHFAINTAPAGTNSIYNVMPVTKGDIVQVRYTASGTTNYFRFIYAQGEV